MPYVPEEGPFLPPTTGRAGIESGVQWFFTLLFAVTLFVLIVVGIQQVEQATTSVATPRASEPVEVIDIGSTPEHP